MTYLIASKSIDFVDEHAEAKALSWLLSMAQSGGTIYAPNKPAMKAIAERNPLLSSLYKHNQAVIVGKDIRLCFGRSPSRNSGNYDLLVTPAPILAMYANPSDFAWIEERRHRASPFCLLPWSNVDVAEWVRSNQPSLI